MLNELYAWNSFWKKCTKHLVGRHVIIDINVTIRIMFRCSKAQVIVLLAMVVKLMLLDYIAQMNVLLASHSPLQA
jgi:hypothetical protein